MTPRTYARHAAARNNFRQRHYAPLSERGQRIAEQGRAQRVELTQGLPLRSERDTAKENKNDQYA